MSISIREITAANFIEAMKLKVKKEQENFVASNAASIAQSKFHTFLECYGVYHEDIMVGFSAFGKNPEDETIWIVRQMIAEQYQGKGYGKAGLAKTIEHLKDKYSCKSIFLDVAPENKGAIHVYEKAGFQDTGKKQGHSVIYELKLE